MRSSRQLGETVDIERSPNASSSTQSRQLLGHVCWIGDFQKVSALIIIFKYKCDF